MILRGLSGAKVTRPGKFRSCQDGYAVKSSLKAEDGVLYPLEKSFFFLPKPPTLILHEEVLFFNSYCPYDIVCLSGVKLVEPLNNHLSCLSK